MDHLELSAFAAYNLDKKEKKRRKKNLLIDIYADSNESSNVPQEPAGISTLEKTTAALAAHGLNGKGKKGQKKKHHIDIKQDVNESSNVPQEPVGASRLEKTAAAVEKRKCDALWDGFVNEFHTIKKKKVGITASTPLLLPADGNGAHETTTNIFLSSPEKKKNKLKSKKLTNISVNGKSKNAGNGSMPSVSKKELKEVSTKKQKKQKIFLVENSFSEDVTEGIKSQTNDVEYKTCPLGHKLKGKLICKKCKKLEVPNIAKKTSETEEIYDVVEESQPRDAEFSPAAARNRGRRSKEEEAIIGNDMSCGSTPINAPEQQNDEKDVIDDSLIKGRDVLEWIISPVPIHKFFSHYWEKQPLHIARSCSNYYDGICSMEDLDLALRLNTMYFGKNVDVTAYENGRRATENPEGRARPSTVWRKFKEGRSIRILNPQTFIPNVGALVSVLQDYFHCMVGVNTYLTPAGTQGFAPHWDDIEAFVMQLEGEKLWKVYAPLDKESVLPWWSSDNLDEEQIGRPIMEVVLHPGDLLYFPRGFIHQARSVPTQHSLHITVSTYQRNTWGRLIAKALEATAETHTNEIPELRQGIPLNVLDHLGAVHSDSKSPERTKILERLGELAKKVVLNCYWDAAADQLGKQYIHDSFPPAVADVPRDSTWPNFFKKPKTSDVAVKLVTRYCIRLVIEDEAVRVYYNTDNMKEYHGAEPQFFEIPVEGGPIVESLVFNYPNFTKLRDLPRDDPITNAQLRRVLEAFYSRSLLLVINYKPSA